MKSIKPYTHEDRKEVINKLIPMLHEEFGDNLIAAAIQGSYARGEDGPYSDLEIIVFLNKFDSEKGWAGIGRNVNGMLVEIVWTTAEKYIESMTKVESNWFIAGSDRLFPIVNPDFVNNIDISIINDLAEKCDLQLKHLWNEIQESTTKVLNCIKAGNRNGFFLVASDMFHFMHIFLSFVNRKPFTTFSKFTEEALEFAVKPDGFDKLCQQLTSGDFADPSSVENNIITVYESLESIAEKHGVTVTSSELKIEDI